jgi:hypothetical protein
MDLSKAKTSPYFFKAKTKLAELPTRKIHPVLPVKDIVKSANDA